LSTAPASERGDAPGTLAAWFLSARPRTLPAAIAPVLVGTAAASREGTASPRVAFLALAGMLLLQVGTNFLNDWGDARRGADGPDRLGPSRGVQSGVLSPEAMLGGGLVAFALATAIGVVLARLGGWPIVAIGVSGLLAGAGYTAGPFPFAYRGLGEVVVFLVFGPLAVCATEFLQGGRTTVLGALASLAIGFLAAAILVVNNVRDVDTDRAAGKRTIAVRLGRDRARFLHPALVAAAAAVPVVAWASGLASARILVALLALPLAVSPTEAVLRSTDGPTLNAALAGTARVMLAFGALLALGIAFE